MKPHRVSVLLNASSGKVERYDRDKAREKVEFAFGRYAIEAELEFLSGAELRSGAERALQRAKEAKLDAVVVSGGDGSIRTVASVLADSGVRLGVIPSGTLNHFAKDLNIPLSIDAAIAVIAAGESRSVDVGEVNGRIFVNNSSVGIYPYLVLDRERRRRRNGVSKWFAMASAVLRAFRHFPVRRLSIRGEGWTDTERSPCVFVGNNEYRLAGLSAGRRETLDGGRLCLYVAKQQSMIGLMWLACRSIVGLLNQRETCAPCFFPQSRSAHVTANCWWQWTEKSQLFALLCTIVLDQKHCRYSLRLKGPRKVVCAQLPTFQIFISAGTAVM